MEKQNTVRQSSKLKRNTLIFIGLFLLAGICYLMSRTDIAYVDSLMFVLNFVIYAGLLIFWIQSVFVRLLPSRSRTYILWAAFLLLFYLVIRAYKYRFSGNGFLTDRYLVYLYSVPMALVPALFLMTCICLFRQKQEKSRWDERLILILPGVIALLFVTNDLHFLAYRPSVDLSQFAVNSGTYTHGPVFFSLYAWIGISMVLGIILLLRKTGLFRLRNGVPPFIMILIWAAMIAALLIIKKVTVHVLYQAPEIHTFCMLGVFESCIRNRLIPYNENHTGFFERLSLPVMITDRFFSTVFQTRGRISASVQDLKDSLEVSVFPEPNQRLTGIRIRSGYAFFTEDESTLNHMNEELIGANEILSHEIEIIEQERKLIEETTGVMERNRLYEKAAKEIYPVQLRISKLLEQTVPGNADFHEKVKSILVLTAYIKRKTNFILLEAERKYISAQELLSAITESAHYLYYLGVNTSVDLRTEEEFPCRSAIALYECFEAALEQLPGITNEAWVSLDHDGLLLMCDSEKTLDLSSFTLPSELKAEDGQLILRIRMGGESI